MERNTTMTEGSIWKKLLFFSIPLILGNLFQQLYNTVDSIIVGNYIGSEALAAVGASGPIITLLIGFCIGASTGAGVVISQYYGAKDKEGVRKAVHTTLAIAIGAGAILTVVGILLVPFILRAMGTPQEVFDKAYRYHNYWKDNGGITVSGGEALLQIEFVTELFKIAKKEGVHTTLDTSGNPFTFEEPFISKFNELMAVTDLFMLDIKHIDDEKHKKLTGWTNKNILDMAKYLSDNNKDMWIRHVLVPKVTDDKEDLQALSDFVKSLKTVKRFEILPYHTLGVFKWHDLGVKYELEDIMPPTKEEIQRADDILHTGDYKGYLEK